MVLEVRLPGVGVGSGLTRHGRDVRGVFDLLGFGENDLTAALAFTLSRSPHLLGLLLDRLGVPGDRDGAEVHTEVADKSGRTDLELRVGGHLVVIEAKRGWLLPSLEQLSKYTERISVGATSGQLVTLSDVSDTYFDTVLPDSVDGVRVSHLAWSVVKAGIVEARRTVGGKERVWLGELDTYLRRAVVETDPASGWALSVVLNDDSANGAATSFREFVTEFGIYFHPFGGWAKGWPTTPPNFMAFRWNNQVQQIRRVVAAEPVPDLVSRWPDMTAPEVTLPHVVYTLGSPLRMIEPLPCGQNYRAAHVWALVDQLLVCSTLQEAIAESRRIAGSPYAGLF